ncbi:MAG: dephospho-CoA kinase [Bacteroides sp.]|nr:dephospho-CoA kinase [Bacteroides sp.]MCM1550887.1 dephospho-CoA kinase [Clostridium sp.]
MKIIGITGGIGAGKSTVLSILKEDYQAYVLEADRVAHAVMEPGQRAYTRIVGAFTDAILDAEGRIHRGRLADVVFQNPDGLKQLNEIVHPEVKGWILDAIQSCRQAVAPPLFIIEAALLIEDGYEEICDELWYIYAPEEVRIRRLMKSRKYSREKCMAIMGNQSPDAFYRSHCTHIIENYHSLENTKKQLEELLKNQIFYDKINQ